MANLGPYKDVDSYARLDGASPHRVTQLMLEALASRVAEATGHVRRGETEAKGVKIIKAVALVEGLIMSLDRERGGDIARNLQDLYDYMLRGLVAANLENDAAKLEEISSLVAEIKTGWDGIAEAAT
ncbi:MAG: flagellar export chaperone FliS [Gammaproteobacteria bacterium]|nr:flagellar export chaperone FliS [Gammaproteobacteria bacterium]